jgi:hypothetical protein
LRDRDDLSKDRVPGVHAVPLQRFQSARFCAAVCRARCVAASRLRKHPKMKLGSTPLDSAASIVTVRASPQLAFQPQRRSRSPRARRKLFAALRRRITCSDTLSRVLKFLHHNGAASTWIWFNSVRKIFPTRRHNS